MTKRCKYGHEVVGNNALKAGLLKSGQPKIRCKECAYKARALCESKNKSKVIERITSWNKRNPEKRQAAQKRYYYSEKGRQVINKHQAVASKELNDWYVKKQVAKKIKIPYKDVSEESKEFVRALLQLKRYLKSKKVKSA